MSSPFETLVYVARLSQSEKASIFAQNDAFPQSNLKMELLKAVEEVCLDRLIRADGCLRVAIQLHGSADEEDLRAAVGRAYYSIHHTLRAMALWENKWDPDGHEESIKQFKLLLQDNSFIHQSGLAIDDWKAVIEARANRHVADYSPYDVQRESSQSMTNITSNNWVSAAQFNCNVANRLLQAAFKIFGL